MANKPITEDEKCKIKELYEKGYSILRIANEIGRSDGAVKKICTRNETCKTTKTKLSRGKIRKIDSIGIGLCEK
jgi:IS30 family transposase